MPIQSVAIIRFCITLMMRVISRSRVVLWQCTVPLLMLTIPAIAEPLVKPDSPLAISIDIQPVQQHDGYLFNVLVVSGVREPADLIVTVQVPDEVLVLDGTTEWQGPLAAGESYLLTFNGQIQPGGNRVISARAVVETTSGIRLTAIDSRPLPGEPAVRSNDDVQRNRYEQRFGQTILTISLDH